MPNGSRYKPRASVTITYDLASGDVEVSEDPIYIMRRGAIDWQCDGGAWTVTVDDSEELFDSGNTVRGRRGERKGGRVRANANGGQPDGRSYKYTVTVQVGGQRFEKDPEVVVGPDEPPDDGGNGG